MPFPINPYWTPITINRNALARDAGAIAAGHWAGAGGRSQAVGSNWEIEEGSCLYSTTPSMLAHPWRAPKTYNFGYDASNVSTNTRKLNCYVISDIDTGTPLNTPTNANAYFRLEIQRNGRHDLYYKTAGAGAIALANSGGALSGAVRTRLRITPDQYNVGEKTFAQHILCQVMNANGGVLWSTTIDFPTNVAGYSADEFEDDWQTWRDSAFDHEDQKRQQAHMYFDVSDQGGTEYWILNHLSIVNEMDSGVHEYVLDPIPDGPELENPPFDPAEQPYMEWGLLDPAGAPFNCATNGTGDNADAFEDCVNWARAYSMGVGLFDGYVIRLERKLELWQWCYQRTSKGNDRDYFVDEFKPPTIIGVYNPVTGTKPQLRLRNNAYPTGSHIFLECNAVNYQTEPPNFRGNWPDSQRIIDSKGAWVDGAVNFIGDMRTYSGVSYLCTFPHTSVLANDRPSTGTNWQQFWEVYDPADSGYPSGGRPNATYNFNLQNFTINLGTGNTACIGLDARGAQGTEPIRVNVIGSGYLAGFGDMPGSGGAVTSCGASGGQHAILSTSSQPGSTLSGFHADATTSSPFAFINGANRGVLTLVGCKTTNIPPGVPMIDNDGSDSTGTGHEMGLLVLRESSFEWTSYDPGNKVLSSDRGAVMKNIYARFGHEFGDIDNTGTGASPVLAATIAVGSTAGWNHLEEAVIPANPPRQTGGNLATLRTAQNAFGVTQTPSPVQYQWSILASTVRSVITRSQLGDNVTPPAALFDDHYIGDDQFKTLADVTIDAKVAHGVAGDGFTPDHTALNAADAAASLGDVIGLKSGIYLLDDTFEVTSGVHLFTPLKQRCFFRPSISPASAANFGTTDPQSRPMLRGLAGADLSVFANIGLWFHPNTPKGMSASFEGNTLVYGLHLMRRSGEGFGQLPGYQGEVAKGLPNVQFYGSSAQGRMYTANIGNGFNTKTGFCFFAVIDTYDAPGSVDFYSLNGEHCEDWPGNTYLHNFGRVRIFSLKGEANAPMLTAYIGRSLECWGPAGNGTPYIHSSINTTGWAPTGDTANETGYNIQPSGTYPANFTFPNGVESQVVMVSQVESYMLGAMQDTGRYQNNNPAVFGWGTRPDGTKFFGVYSDMDGTGTETFASAVYDRPLFAVDGYYDSPIVSNVRALSVLADGFTPAADTSKASGTFYMTVTANGDLPDDDQIIAGQNQSGTAALVAESVSGDVPVGTTMFTPVSGLSSSTTFTVSTVYVDRVGSRSAVGRTTVLTDTAGGPSPSLGAIVHYGMLRRRKRL